MYLSCQPPPLSAFWYQVDFIKNLKLYIYTFKPNLLTWIMWFIKICGGGYYWQRSKEQNVIVITIKLWIWQSNRSTPNCLVSTYSAHKSSYMQKKPLTKNPRKSSNCTPRTCSRLQGITCTKFSPLSYTILFLIPTSRFKSWTWKIAKKNKSRFALKFLYFWFIYVHVAL